MTKQNIIIGAVVLLIGYGLFRFVKYAYDQNKETQYCGKVVKRYMTDAGYKISSSRHIVFYSESLHRNVDVRVTNQAFANIVEGEMVCFSLNKVQLEE